MKRIAIFASGSGSNAENIAQYFAHSPLARVELILSNRPQAYVLDRARRLGIAWASFDRQAFYHSPQVLDLLAQHQIDFVVLAGFLWLVPPNLLQHYPQRIVNIHPALLPKYGGRGMFGEHVHQAVVQAGERESGITIHYVNELYDEGQAIFQARCTVEPTDTPDSLAAKVHALEYEHFPRVIEQLLLGEG